MKVIVVGCGQVGETLAYQLYKMGHQVVVIDRDEQAFDHLPDDFQGRTVKGDVLTRTVLHRAEVNGADALFALTGSDPLNALVAHIARSEYSVANVAARNNDPRQLPLQEAFGVSVISTPGWRADSVVDLLAGEAVRAIYLDHNADLIIYKLEVPAKWEGHNLDELIPVERSEILKWTRNGGELPTAEPHFLAVGDQIYLKADAEVIEAMRSRLDARQEQKA
jgi:trk system potassium uptake protein TrkA